MMSAAIRIGMTGGHMPEETGRPFPIMRARIRRIEAGALRKSLAPGLTRG